MALEQIHHNIGFYRDNRRTGCGKRARGEVEGQLPVWDIYWITEHWQMSKKYVKYFYWANLNKSPRGLSTSFAKTKLLRRLPSLKLVSPNIIVMNPVLVPIRFIHDLSYAHIAYAETEEVEMVRGRIRSQPAADEHLLLVVISGVLFIKRIIVFCRMFVRA